MTPHYGQAQTVMVRTRRAKLCSWTFSQPVNDMRPKLAPQREAKPAVSVRLDPAPQN